MRMPWRQAISLLGSNRVTMIGAGVYVYFPRQAALMPGSRPLKLWSEHANSWLNQARGSIEIYADSARLTQCRCSAP